MTQTQTMHAETTPAQIPTAFAPPAFGRLVAVELRKMTDTRSGRGLLITVVALALAISIGQAFTYADDPDLRMAGFLQGPAQISGMIAPVLGLMALTSEFTQRTALTTFTLAPQRLRVLGAKFLAAMLLTIVVTAVAIALTTVAALVTSAVGGMPVIYSGTGDMLRGTLVVLVLMTVMAAAFGALIPHTAIAVAVLLGVPAGFSIFASAVLGEAAPWFDAFAAFERLSDADPLLDWPQTLVATTIWIVVPAAVGVTRLARRDIN